MVDKCFHSELRFSNICKGPLVYIVFKGFLGLEVSGTNATNKPFEKKLHTFRTNATKPLNKQTARYSNLNKKYRNKLQVLQNKCICFRLHLNNREYIGTEYFDKVNWLPIDQGFKQCLSKSVFKSFCKKYSHYMNKVYKTSNQKIYFKLFQQLRFGYICLPLICNSLPDGIKLSSNVNTFKHKVKMSSLTILREKDQDIYVFYGQVNAFVTSFWYYCFFKLRALTLF